MTDIEAVEMAKRLLDSFGGRAFEISMPDQHDYDLMRKTFADLGHETGPDGEFFVVKVFARNKADGSPVLPSKEHTVE